MIQKNQKTNFTLRFKDSHLNWINITNNIVHVRNRLGFMKWNWRKNRNNKEQNKKVLFFMIKYTLFNCFRFLLYVFRFFVYHTFVYQSKSAVAWTLYEQCWSKLCHLFNDSENISSQLSNFKYQTKSHEPNAKLLY